MTVATITTQAQVNAIVQEARDAAVKASQEYFLTKLNGQDMYACGFAWVNIYGVKGNTKLGKMLKAAGMRQDYSKAFQIWNPGGLSIQNIDAKEVGANAAANVFRKYGFNSYGESRLD